MFGELGFHHLEISYILSSRGELRSIAGMVLAFFLVVSSFLGLFYTPTRRMRCFEFIKMYNYSDTLQAPYDLIICGPSYVFQIQV